jgi:DNA-binding MarR family transcriptional regulator
MDFEKTLSYLFLQNANIFRVKLEREMNKIGLHYGQVFILISLWKNDGQSQTDLAKDLILSPPTINKMVKNLAENKFIESRQSEKDNRVMHVFLTEKGREAEESFSELFQTLQQDFFVSLTETEQLIFLQLCEKLKANIS